LVVVLAPPVILSQCFLFHLTAALTRNALDCVALVALACPALLPVVGHHILSIGPAPEVALILCSAAVNTLQPVLGALDTADDATSLVKSSLTTPGQRVAWLALVRAGIP